MIPPSQDTNRPTASDHDLPLGRIVSVSGSQAVVLLCSAELSQAECVAPAEMGTLVKIEIPGSVVLGLISALSVPVPSNDPTEPEMRVIELEFVGELPRDARGSPQAFRRGISKYPALGDQVYHASNDILAMAYACNSADGIRLGTIVQEPSIPAMAKTDDLLGKHLAILGASGTGKSCAVALLLRSILAKTPNAHLVLLDPHREYQPAFAGMAEVVTAENLTLPFWLLTFEEMVEILIGTQPGREADIETLREMIPIAKARYGTNQRRVELRSVLSGDDQDSIAPSVDTPVPYRISDLVALLNECIGKLDLRGERAPFKRLKSRLEAISRDPRYAFMFGSLTVQDTMADVLGRIFRVPVNGRPITIFELAGLPSEIINVVVSVLSRMAFDFAMWGNGRVPITLVCEEAHRYAPAEDTLGFQPTKRALSKIAKEGRKYGVSLCMVSQRPAELDPTILSQCASMVCMRLTNERDQDIARARVSDGSASLLEVLPSLATGEAVVFGEGVAMPTRIRFDRLPPEAMPRSSTAKFSQDWQYDVVDSNFLNDIVGRWRAQGLGEAAHEHAAEHHTPAEQNGTNPHPAEPPAMLDGTVPQAPRAPALPSPAIQKSALERQFAAQPLTPMPQPQHVQPAARPQANAPLQQAQPAAWSAPDQTPPTQAHPQTPQQLSSLEMARAAIATAPAAQTRPPEPAQHAPAGGAPAKDRRAAQSPPLAYRPPV